MTRTPYVTGCLGNNPFRKLSFYFSHYYRRKCWRQCFNE